jgi:hypothetical protein
MIISLNKVSKSKSLSHLVNIIVFISKKVALLKEKQIS